MRKDFKYVENGDKGDEIDTRVGLCVNCKHHTACTFCGSPSEPKLFCEEFECLGASCSEFGDGISVVRDEPVPPVIESDAGEQDAGKYMGLCVNCENRESCCHTIPASGIWYCEEYR
jgi:hypothetical protein